MPGLSQLLQVSDVTFGYARSEDDPDAWLLQIPELVVESRTIYSLLGKNMSGKSTLLRLLAGLEPVRTAWTKNRDARIAGVLASKLAGRRSFAIAVLDTMLLSHSDRMFPELSLWDNVRIAKSARNRLTTAVARHRFREYLKRVSILASLPDSTPLSSLSSGAQALVRLARPYTWQARLVLIDEVTAHLDAENRSLFFTEIGDLLRNGCSFILVSHRDTDHDTAKTIAANVGANYVSWEIGQEGNKSCVA